MRLVALVDSPEHVCCRYRLAAFAPFLARAGHSLRLIAWPRDLWSRLRLRRELRSDDLVILQRKLLDPLQFRALRGACRRLLFDFDDAVFLRDSYALKGMVSARRWSRFLRIAQSADAVIAGNDFLAARSRSAGARSVHVIPTCVDPGRYALAGHLRSGEGVELGWIGSASTLQGLEQIRPLLEQVGQSCPGIRLKVIADRFPEFQHLPVLPCHWSQKDEAEDLASVDIGVSWLPDDDWSRGKCGLKILQYMAAGLPVIANRVGLQQEMVEQGETGFLAETPAQWIEAVKRLAGDPALRRRMGCAGRSRLERDYSVAAGAACWLKVLQQFEEGRGAA